MHDIIIESTRIIREEKTDDIGRDGDTYYAAAKTVPLLSNGVFPRQCWPLVDLCLGVFDWKVQRFCWPKGTSLECAELIYVKITETACVSDELCRFKEEEEEEEERL